MRASPEGTFGGGGVSESKCEHSGTCSMSVSAICMWPVIAIINHIRLPVSGGILVSNSDG